jgi:hypothetical protein
VPSTNRGKLKKHHMGCVPSKAAAAKRRRLDAEAAAARAERENVARSGLEGEAAAAEEATAAEAAARAVPRRLTSRVDQKRDMYERLEHDARSPPELVPLAQVVVGQRSRKLLEGFEKKEAEARAPPVLQSIDRKDLRCSTEFAKMLGDYEDKDAKAAAEPKLEKTFVQREKESVERIQAITTAAVRPVS